MSQHKGPIIQLPKEWKDSLLARLSMGQRHGDAENRLSTWIDRLIDDANKQGFNEPDSPDMVEKYPTEAARQIFTEHFPEWARLFLKKNEHYGDTANHLGAPGQFADINRKFWPLKRILWDHEELPGESAEEIIMDMIGHLFLTLYFLAKEEELGNLHERYEIESRLSESKCTCGDDL